ncbi:MAG TPA: tetratricopeptide repeat protein, partial [Blastocatellia bacterium]|nr:tetratricopeptide repeat protein [Blastocatellia bacterium]
MNFISSAKWLFSSGLRLTAILLMACLSLVVNAQSNSSNVQSDYDAAMALTEPAERIAALRQFIQNHPASELADSARENMMRGLAALGEVQLAERNIERAMDYFKQAIAASPVKMSDKFFEETASRIPLAISLRGYRAEAIAVAREMEVRFIGDARKLALLGEFYVTAEAAGDALRVLKIATRLAPKEARYRRSLAIAYRLNLRLDEAAEEYKAAIALEPNDKRAYYELANIERGRGAYAEAIKLYRRQLELDPQHTASHKGLALAYIAQGKNDLAATELKQAGEIKQDFVFQTQLAFTH